MSGKSNELKKSVGLCYKCNTSTLQYTEKFLQINYLYRDQTEEISVVFGREDSGFWKSFSIE
jgi:hypothetical protein